MEGVVPVLKISGSQVSRLFFFFPFFTILNVVDCDCTNFRSIRP